MGDPYRGRALLCDEMGLGKTVTALQFALEYDGLFIIFCPAALQRQWRCEMQRFAPADAVARGTIISYDRVHNADLDPSKFTVAIADEAHYLKDPQSRRARVCVPFLQRVRRALLLTGTPVPNRPIELWPLLMALRPHEMPDYETFGRVFAAGYRDRHGFHARGSSNAAALADILQRRFMVRRTQAQLALGLPPLKVDVQHVDLPCTQRRRLAQLMEQMEDARGVDQKNALISAMFAETAKAKRDAAAECMLRLAREAAPSPLVVFAHHRCMMDALKARAEASGLRVGIIDGRASHAQKHAVAQAVQENAVDVALLSLVAAATGFNLTQSHTVLFAELYWVPATIAQAQARVWRLGQTHAVQVCQLVARDTCDERVLTCLANKKRVRQGLFCD